MAEITNLTQGTRLVDSVDILNTNFSNLNTEVGGKVNTTTYDTKMTSLDGSIGILSSGKVDVSTYNTDMIGKADKATTLAGYGITDGYGDSDFAIVTVNNGNNIVSNSRYVINNPFPNYYVHCVAEIFLSNKWGNPEWYSDLVTNPLSPRGVGVRANQFDEHIVVQTGTIGLMWNGGICGTPFEYQSGNSVVSAPCRVKVWKVGKIQ